MDALESRARAPATRCSLRGCLNTTRERKPYCSDHVEHLDYAQSLAIQIIARKEEMKSLKRDKDIPEKTSFDSEVLGHLAQTGTKTIKKLALELNIKYEILLKIMKSLSRRGHVKIRYTKRLKYTAELS